jgi:hypothetical protein
MHAYRAALIRTLATIWACSLAGPVQAQVPREAGTPPGAREPRWEIEAYGGLVAARTAGGSRAFPVPGPPIVTSNPIFPSRQTASWFFGDGATLLNDVNAEFDSLNQITPLDTLFSRLGSARVAIVGVRLRRRLTDRFSAELSVDAVTRPEDRVDGFGAAVDATRRSFTTAFAGLLSTGPFDGVAIDATGAAEAGHRRETAATVAINARLGAWGSFVPYATCGGGVMTGSGSLPSAALEGRYRFSILGEVPIDETDRVSLRFVRGAALIAVLGGGVRRDVSSRWGFRVDARVLIGPDSTRVLLDASPSAIRGAPAGFIESFTNPAVQFSNDSSTGRRSTLSGAALDGFEAFGGGVQTRTLITFGVSRRF